jgi:MerR family transcriptional regulator, light-induced transcriptional regulator
MYTIKQASLRTGIDVSLIRAWERRYGVVHPERSAGGYRLYDEDAIARLRAMRVLIARGWSAAQAAAEVVDAPPSAGAAASGPSGLADIGRGLVDAAGRYDVAAVDRLLDELFGRGSFEAVIDNLVLPAVRMLGEAWADGKIDVAAEHLASGAVLRRLSALFSVGGMAGSGPHVLVGLPPDSRHELGALAFAVALRRLGVDVLYLGADVPVASWVDAASQSSATAAAIGIVTSRDIAGAVEVAGGIRVARPDLILALGGSSSGRVTVPADVVHLPASIVEAAQLMQARIASR